MDPVEQLRPHHDLLALHRYYLWVNRLGALYDGVLSELGQKPITADTVFDHDAIMYMSFWYSGLYTVIEGWQKLGLSALGIDEMLESRHVTLLRRYRNGIGH